MARMTGVYHHAQQLAETGSCCILPKLAWNFEPPNLHFLISWNYRPTCPA
jgi:hypothetical protein